MSKKYNPRPRVGPNLFRELASGVYHARVKINRQTKRRCLRTTDRALAEQFRDEWLREVRANTPSKESKDLTLRQVAHLLLGDIKVHKPRSHRHATDLMKMILLQCPWPGGADIKFSKVTESHLRTLFLWTIGKGGVPICGLVCTDVRRPEKVGRPVAAATYNHAVCLMRDLFEYGKQEKFRVDDPMLAAKIRMRPDDVIVRLTPSIDEFRAIGDYVRSNRFNHNAAESADFLEFMGVFGLGNAEVESLTWGMVDYKLRVLRLQRIKTAHDIDVPIYPWAVGVMNRLRKRAEAPGGEGTATDTRIFSIRTPVRALLAACNAIGIGPFTARGLRRMFIYLCAWGNVPIETVAFLQGHQDSGKLIREIYDNARCVSDDQRKQERLDAVRAEVNAVTPLYVVDGTEELEIPSDAPSIMHINPGTVLLPDLAAALGAAKASLMEKWERMRAALSASRWKAVEAHLSVLQPELRNLFEDDAPAAEAYCMRKVKNAQYDAKIEALIEVGNLELVADENRRLLNVAQNKVRAIKQYMKYLAVEEQMDLLRLQLAEAKAIRQAHETLCRRLAVAIKRVKRIERTRLHREAA